jgi:glycosyltransferase involved in cell wall biosynthesis
MRANPMLSVIIASFNRVSYLLECIESILLCSNCDNFEVIVVWQGDDIQTKLRVEKKFKNYSNIKCIHSGKLGASSARNIGALKARGDILAFIDDDAIAQENWVNAYIKAFCNSENVPGIAGGKVMPKWEGERPEWLPEEQEYLLGIYDKGDEMMEFPGQDLPFMANVALLRERFLEVGGIEEKIGFDASKKSISSGADSLLALRVKEQGGNIVYVPDAAIYHRIVGAKLKVRYFLKRYYYEGKSLVTMLNLRRKMKRIELYNTIKHHLIELCINSYNLIKSLFLFSPIKSSRVMLYSTKCLLNVGVINQSIVLLKLDNNP